MIILLEKEQGKRENKEKKLKFDSDFTTVCDTRYQKEGNSRAFPYYSCIFYFAQYEKS